LELESESPGPLLDHTYNHYAILLSVSTTLYPEASVSINTSRPQFLFILATAAIDKYAHPIHATGSVNLQALQCNSIFYRLLPREEAYLAAEDVKTRCQDWLSRQGVGL